MKFIKLTFTIGVLSGIIGHFLPFWSIVLTAIIITLAFDTKPLASFFAGFMAIFLLWSALAFYIDTQTASLLTNKVAQVFMGISNMTLILVSGVVGGILGGFGAATGALLRELVKPKKSSGYYG